MTFQDVPFVELEEERDDQAIYMFSKSRSRSCTKNWRTVVASLMLITCLDAQTIISTLDVFLC